MPTSPRMRLVALTVVALVLLATSCSSDGDGVEQAVSPSSTATSSDLRPTGEQADDLPSTPAPAPTTPTPTTPAPTTPASKSFDPLSGNLTVDVVNSIPHDPLAYTQGLEWHDGWLYESTGQYGASDRRRLDPSTGEIDLVVALDDSLFGEGLTIVGDEALQLSWREGQLLRSSLDDLEIRSTQRYDGEGWGLCELDGQLVMSDGSATLTRRNLSTFEPISTLDVTSNGEPVERLNELECVGDQILANVYGLDQIVVIDPTTGIVVAVVDASSLRPDGLPADDADYVLNGIAHQPETGRWFLTGKYWPVIFEVEIVAE